MATITKQGQKGNLTKLDLDYEGTKDGEDQVKDESVPTYRFL